MKNKKSIYMALIVSLFSCNFLGATLKDTCKERLANYNNASKNYPSKSDFLRSRMLVDFVDYCKIAGENKYSGDENIVDDVLKYLKTNEEKKTAIYYALRSLEKDINDTESRLQKEDPSALKSLDGKDISALIEGYKNKKKTVISEVKKGEEYKQMEKKVQGLSKNLKENKDADHNKINQFNTLMQVSGQEDLAQQQILNINKQYRESEEKIENINEKKKKIISEKSWFYDGIIGDLETIQRKKRAITVLQKYAKNYKNTTLNEKLLNAKYFKEKFELDLSENKEKMKAPVKKKKVESKPFQKSNKDKKADKGVKEKEKVYWCNSSKISYVSAIAASFGRFIYDMVHANNKKITFGQASINSGIAGISSFATSRILGQTVLKPKIQHKKQAVLFSKTKALGNVAVSCLVGFGCGQISNAFLPQKRVINMSPKKSIRDL